MKTAIETLNEIVDIVETSADFMSIGINLTREGYANNFYDKQPMPPHYVAEGYTIVGAKSAEPDDDDIVTSTRDGNKTIVGT